MADAAILLAMLPLLLSISCSNDSGDKEAAVPVQVVTVRKETMQRTVTAEAILFPLQQAAITPKISAPVKAFYIKRGSRVHKGQLLAVLENSDLAAAAQENKGSYDQAQAVYETTTVADSTPGSPRRLNSTRKLPENSLTRNRKSTTAVRNFFNKGRCLAKNSTRPEWT